MSWFSSILGGVAGETLSGTLNGVGDAAIKLREAITGDLPPEKKAELELKAMELEQALAIAQSEVNKIEASSPSLFIAGWRPAAGWLGVIGLACAAIGRPLLAWASLNLGWIEPPEIDTGVLITLLMGLLGLGTMRTVEKAKGVEGNR